MLKIKA